MVSVTSVTAVMFTMLGVGSVVMMMMRDAARDFVVKDGRTASEARANVVELDGTFDKLYSVGIYPRSFSVPILYNKLLASDFRSKSYCGLTLNGSFRDGFSKLREHFEKDQELYHV